MNKTASIKINVMLLTAALIFGQLGSGFFHNKHDAHETIIDLDKTVLVEHGEHCKICSVDWVHQFIATDNTIEITCEQPRSFEQVELISFISFSQSRASDRAPPVTA